MGSRPRGRTSGLFCSFAAALVAMTVAGSCSARPVLVGVPLVLTGVNSQIGVSGRNGIELAAREVNARGGIGGRRLEILVRDDGDDPDQAIRVDEELASLGAVALVGHMTSKAGLKAIPWSGARGLLLVSPTISSEDWTGKDDWFFRIIDSNSGQGRLLASTALDRGYRRAVMFAESSNGSYTKAIATSFAEAFEAGGGEAGTAIAFTAGPGLDHLGLAGRALAAKPDLVLFAGPAYDSGLFCQALSKLGPRPPVFAPMWSMTGELFVEGGRTVEGMVVVGTFDPASLAPEYRGFREAYLAAYGEEPSFGAVHGYDSLMLLARAAARAKRLDARGIKEAIMAIRDFPGLQGDITIDSYGDCTRPYRAFEARGGRFVALDGE